MKEKEKQEVYLLFCGDRYLDQKSMQLLAVCSGIEKAVELAELDAKGWNEELSDEDKFELIDERQTYNRENNYLIASVFMDEL